MKVAPFILRYKLHLLPLWVLLFLGWHYFRYQDYPAAVAWWITFVKVADLALLVCITNYLLIPGLLYKKKYVLFAIVYLLVIIAGSIGKLLLELELLHLDTINLTGRWKQRIYDNVIPHFLLVTTGAAFKLLADYARTQRRMGELAREKAEAELNFLRSQINPHFLFNSLNGIYFLIDKENTAARQTLRQFADLLRYQLYDCNANTVAIEKEVKSLRDYIRLQEMRKDQQYQISLQVGEEVKGFSISPLLLIPFVENAFKHISHYPDNGNYVHVDLQRKNGTFTLTVENSKDDQQRITEPTGGIGLRNTKRRLELLYPDRHQLKISDMPDRYTITLDIQLS